MDWLIVLCLVVIIVAICLFNNNFLKFKKSFFDYLKALSEIIINNLYGNIMNEAAGLE